MKKTATRQLYVVLLIVLFGFIGNSIAYPILAPLFLKPVQHSIIPFDWSIHSRSIFLGITLMMYPIGQFIGSPILGALSDRHGCKKVILISTLAITGFYLITALSLTFHLLWLLIIIRFFTGCAEGNLSIARSIVVNEPDLDKHKSLGSINAMTCLGYVLGPLLGGALSDPQLISWFSFSVPFYTATLLSVIVLLLVSCCLYESRIEQHTLAFSTVRLVQQLNLLKRLRVLCQNKNLKFLLITSSIASLSYDTYYEFYPAYMTGLWHATPLEIAWYTVVLSIVMAVGCAWLSPLLSNYLSNRQLILCSMLLIALVLLMLLFLLSPLFVLILFAIMGFAIAIATTNFILQLSEATDANIQGEVFGTMWGIRMLLDGLISIIGGLMIILSFTLPLAFAMVIALTAWLIYWKNTSQP